MNYRREIDGLRAIAVLSVIIFHSGFTFLSGGFVGVDVFFVISGYLITALIYSEIKAKKFSFAVFYKRRIARLLPALIVMLVGVLIIGMLLYDNQEFDNLGKVVFYSAIGAANILFAQGANYFAAETASNPLVHLWSLGVEEQFYLIWPIILIMLSYFRAWLVILTIIILFFISLLLSIQEISVNATTAYYYPQYRAFELLIGSAIATLLTKEHFVNLVKKQKIKNVLSALGLLLIISPMFILSEESKFPGVNALWPCIGSALIILYAQTGFVGRLLSLKPLVSIGLISYPLYLFHQPIISTIGKTVANPSTILTLAVVLIIALPLSWFTLRFIERPFRTYAKVKGGFVPKISTFALVSVLMALAVGGLLIAKMNGFPVRFKVLNEFSYKVSKESETTFHGSFERGFKVSESAPNKVLFFGDSALQQYVFPLAKALKIDISHIDTVTRGGCVLLKNVEFRDKYSDISCDDIRDKLFKLNQNYKYIVFSQSWGDYIGDLLNSKIAPEQNEKLDRWAPYISQTIDHFKKYSNQILIIGGHLDVSGTKSLGPNLFLTEQDYLHNLTNLSLENKAALQQSVIYFKQFEQKDAVVILNPVEIFCNDECRFNDSYWSYFSDELHISAASTQFVVNRLQNIKIFNTLD